MEEDVGPVILINKFSVDPQEFDQFLKGWAIEAEKFKAQPGFISTQLHKGIGESGTFINYAVWESAAQFKAAVNVVMNPQDRMSAYPPGTVASPHLFKKVAVPGICVLEIQNDYLFVLLYTSIGILQQQRMQYYIGCSGWSYSSWQGPFYPKSIENSRWLKYYSNVFDYVEIDSSFYRIPNEYMVKNWYNRTPKNFRFTAFRR